MDLDYDQEIVFFHELGMQWRHKFEQSQSLQDLDMSTMFARKALDSTTPFDSHPSRPALLSTLSTCFNQRFDRTGSLDALNEALRYLEAAQAIAPKNDPERPGILNNLGIALGRHFEKTRKKESLDRAVSVSAEAVRTAPSSDHRRSGYISNFNTWIAARCSLTGSTDDIKAINHGSKLMRAILCKMSGKERDWPALMKSFGDHLHTRHGLTGALDDLNEAIDVYAKAADSVDLDHAFKATVLEALGVLLRERFEKTASTDDLSRSVSALRYAVNTCPLDSPDRPKLLNNLANSLGKRSERIPCSEPRPDLSEKAAQRVSRPSMRIACPHDLDDAIDVAKESVEASKDDTPGVAGWLRTLSMWLSKRGSSDIALPGDLDRALESGLKALEGCRKDDQKRWEYYNHVGICFWYRSERDKSVDDMDSAIRFARLALGALRDGSPNRGLMLRNLGVWQRVRSEMTGSADDLDAALSTSREGFESGHGSPMIRIVLAQEVAEIAVSKDDWKLASEYFQKAVHLLSDLGPRSSKHSDTQVEVVRFAGLATRATSAALNAGEDLLSALQVLEVGRGIIANTLMDTRHDISELESKHQELARKFVTLRDKLDSATAQASLPVSLEDLSSTEAKSKLQREADKEFKELIVRIRSEPGFERFLMPPAMEDLKAAAKDGTIIVVNLSNYRSDAFLINRQSIRLVKLPDLNKKEAEKRAAEKRTSKELLKWLWDVVCCPILEELGFTETPSDDNWPRVWWIPTGILSQLPLHAAGCYGSGRGETVLDRVMSSYASSIRALQHGRQNSANLVSKQALLVAMSTTPDLQRDGALPFASDEISILKDLCPSLDMTPVIPPRNKASVLQHLKDCKVFHFAGHGKSSQEPADSQLLLEDWNTNPLTVKVLRDSRLQDNPPFLAYLSACSTSATDIPFLADEGVHLVSALQLAGFRHVVGTLWEVHDKYCVEVAKVLYKTLAEEGMTDIAVCRGLHRAQRALRNRHMEQGESRNAKLLRKKIKGSLDNTYWIPYVHFGC